MDYSKMLYESVKCRTRKQLHVFIATLLVLIQVVVAGEVKEVKIFAIRHAQSSANRNSIRWIAGMPFLHPFGINTLRNPFLTDEGCHQAFEKSYGLYKELAKYEFGVGAQKTTIGNMCSPLNRTIQTWFLEMTDFVRRNYTTWDNAIDAGIRVQINPYLREAQDNGNQDSFGPKTIKKLKKQLEKCFKKCIYFMRCRYPFQYSREFFPSTNRFSRNGEETKIFDLDYMYGEYIKHYEDTLADNQLETFKTLDFVAKKDQVEDHEWKWDNRSCRPRKKWKFTWRENLRENKHKVLLNELDKSFKAAADLAVRGKKALVLVSHGQKLMLAAERQTDFRLAREVHNAERIPLTMKYTLLHDETGKVRINYPLAMDREKQKLLEKRKEKGTTKKWACADGKDPWNETVITA